MKDLGKDGEEELLIVVSAEEKIYITAVNMLYSDDKPSYGFVADEAKPHERWITVKGENEAREEFM